MLRKINIFRAGKQISSNGYERIFSEEDLESMVVSFNPEVHEPPVRVGHEDNDKVPSFGWVKKLQRIGERLYAFVEFTPEMEEMVDKKHYKKVSASFYAPESPANPHKGNFTLRHLAMLGGQPPAVKGLEPFSFSEEEGLMALETDYTELVEETEVSFEELKAQISDMEAKFAELSLPNESLENQVKELALKVQEFSEFSDKTDTKDLEERITSLEQSFACSDKKKKDDYEEPSEEEEEEASEEEEEETSFEEIKEDKRISALETELAELRQFAEQVKREKEEAELTLEEERKSRRREVIRGKISAIYSEGRLSEGIYPKRDLYDFSVGLEEGTLEFSEGKSAVDTLLSILSSLPEPVSFEEFAADADTKSPETNSEEGMDFADKVEKYAKDHSVTFEEALRMMMPTE